jgi:hypothetical protein
MRHSDLVDPISASSSPGTFLKKSVGSIISDYTYKDTHECFWEPSALNEEYGYEGEVGGRQIEREFKQDRVICGLLGFYSTELEHN